MLIVGIAGGSGSGKTTFSKKISNKKNIFSKNVNIVHLDSYYLNQLPKHLKMNQSEYNFDHPDAFDWQLLVKHLNVLKKGGTIEVPHYDFTTSSRTKKATTIGPLNAVLFEGIYALWNPAVRAMLDVKVFLKVDADIRFIRRLHRDVKERGRSLDGIIRQYYDTVRPMHREFIEAAEQYADIVVGEENEAAADLIAAQLEQVILNVKK